MGNYPSQSVSRAGSHPRLRKEKSSFIAKRMTSNLRKRKLESGEARMRRSNKMLTSTKAHLSSLTVVVEGSHPTQLSLL